MLYEVYEFETEGKWDTGTIPVLILNPLFQIGINFLNSLLEYPRPLERLKYKIHF